MALALPIPVDQAALARFAERYHLRSISLFGSAANGDFGPDSDVDVLVEFEGQGVDFFTLADMEDELSAQFGRKTEIFTEAGLSPYFRDDVVNTALRLYEKSR